VKKLIYIFFVIALLSIAAFIFIPRLKFLFDQKDEKFDPAMVVKKALSLAGPVSAK